jgi:plastocyanin
MTSQTGQSMVGQMRFNPSNQQIEVYDGISWLTMSNSHASIGLTGDAEEAVAWAIEKRREEQELKELCAQHPGLQEAYDKFQVMKALCTPAPYKEEVK